MELLAHRAINAIAKGRYIAAIARGEHELSEAQNLRSRCFGLEGKDCDPFDSTCQHVLVRCAQSHRLVACFRMFFLEGHSIFSSYSAQYYALDALSKFEGSMIELGRFCVDPLEHDPDIVRVAWAAITACVDACNVTFLFGCSSFEGNDSGQYIDSFAMLRDRHLAPSQWMPRVKAPEVFEFSQISTGKPDLRRAILGIPALLRTYLAMGGWVGDHAVIDRGMNTLHVFTGVEIAKIPAARKRLLRALVG